MNRPLSVIPGELFSSLIIAASNFVCVSYGGYGGGGGGGGMYGRPQPFYNQGYSQRARGFAPRARGGGPTDFGRPIIHYRDLDAPREPEEFI